MDNCPYGQNNAEKRNQFWNDYQNKKIKEKIFEKANYANQKHGLIGPDMNKERLLSHFRRKLTYEEFLDKRKKAEHVKINLNEEMRLLNKWISEHEELIKYKHKEPEKEEK